MRRVAGAAVLLLALGGCAVNFEDPAEGAMRCDPGSGRSGRATVLMAQAVPTASALPCVLGSSDDWTIHEFEARDGRARFLLSYVDQMSGDSPRGVRVELSRDCPDLEPREEVRSEHPGMRQYHQVVRDGSRYADRWYHVYPGGCTTYRFMLRGTGAPAQAWEIMQALDFVSREKVRQLVRDRSEGHLELDPGHRS